MSTREFERICLERMNRNGSMVSWQAITPEQIRNCFITYKHKDDDDDYWWGEPKRKVKIHFDKWIDAYDALSYVSFKNGSEVCVEKDLGEFNTDGADVRSLFESCGVAREK